MIKPNTASLEVTPAINGREMMGLLSARFIHTFANQLVVITGNLCAAAQAQADPGKAGSALQSALQAANTAGKLIDQFAQARGTMKEQTGFTSVPDLMHLLEGWVANHPGWILETASGSRSADQAAPLSPSLLSFILDAVVRAVDGRDGVLKMIFLPVNWRAPRVLVNSHPTGWLQLAMTCRATATLDWQCARSEFKNLELVAAYELLAQVQASPESQTSPSGLHSTVFTIPLVTKSAQ